MKRCAFLTMANMDEFECYDNLLYQPFARIGWDVTPVPWRSKNVNWSDFDVVVIRSPWDYQQDPALFMSVLEAIEDSSAQLENSLEIVRWNIKKTYLRDLQASGIKIVPTLWKNEWQAEDLNAFFTELNTTEIIIKPVVSANADDTFRLRQPAGSPIRQKLQAIFSDRPFMVQPFMADILTEGEFSLFYFGGTYSHTISKTPGEGDFRVQEEHGGRLRSVKPEPELLAASEKTMHALPERPLYARIDFVRTPKNHFALMEVEVIEPSLYFNMDPASPERFARCFKKWMQDIR